MRTSTLELPDKLNRLMAMLSKDETNTQLERRCVEVAISLGRFDIVISLAEASLARNPTDSGALFDIATGLIGQGQYRSALESLQRLEAIGPQNAAIKSNMGLCFYCLGEFDRALPHLTACYVSGERNPGLVRLLVSSHHHLGQLDQAVAIANDNIDVALSDGALSGIYALLFLDADDVAKAARWSKVALDLNPKSIDGRVTRATLSTARLQLEDARQTLEAVLEDAPHTGRAWIGLGALALLERNLPMAKRHISRGLELMPTHIGSWHVLAWTNLLSGDLEAAERAFQTALAGDRNFSESHGGLAVIAAMRGERERAEPLLKVALRLDATCLSARFAQALLEGQTDPARAQRIIRAAVGELTAKNGSALGQLLARVIKH